jgi:hypothetical protein
MMTTLNWEIPAEERRVAYRQVILRGAESRASLNANVPLSSGLET